MSSAISTRRRGQSIIETVVGIMFLVPIVLFLADIAILVLCNTANDNLAKSACRAAASAVNGSGTGDAGSGFNAATQICKNFNCNQAIITAPGGSTDGANLLTGFGYNATGSVDNGGGPALPGSVPGPVQGQCTVITTMHVLVPIPFPFLPSTYDFSAKDVEPIVSIAP